MRPTNTSREKLVNAVLFFSANTQKPTMTKMFKLLSFLDFRHFNETGRSVTNLKYHSLKRGPVPLSFYEEVKGNNIPNDLRNFLSIAPFQSEEKAGGIFKGKKEADLTVFTPRQQRILREVAEVFYEADADTASAVSHLEGTPWHKTVKSKGYNQEIDYLLSIDDNSPITVEQAKESLADESEFVKNYPPLPAI